MNRIRNTSWAVVLLGGLIATNALAWREYHQLRTKPTSVPKLLLRAEEKKDTPVVASGDTPPVTKEETKEDPVQPPLTHQGETNPREREKPKPIDVTLMPKALVDGDRLLVVLFTKSSSLLNRDHREEFVQQLEKMRGSQERRLLDRKLYVLTKDGVLREWTGKGQVLSEDLAFDNEQFVEMFKSAFQAIARMKKRAREETVVTLLLWETDVDPAASDRDVKPPTDLIVRLCLRYTGDKEIHHQPEKWFGKGAVGQPKSIDKISDIARQLLRAK